MWPLCDVTEVSEMDDGSTILWLTPSKDKENPTQKAVNRGLNLLFSRVLRLALLLFFKKKNSNIFFSIFEKLLLINVSISRNQNLEFISISSQGD